MGYRAMAGALAMVVVFGCGGTDERPGPLRLPDDATQLDDPSPLGGPGSGGNAGGGLAPTAVAPTTGDSCATGQGPRTATWTCEPAAGETLRLELTINGTELALRLLSETLAARDLSVEVDVEADGTLEAVVRRPGGFFTEQRTFRTCSTHLSAAVVRSNLCALQLVPPAP